jgi:hypothetical protein
MKKKVFWLTAILGVVLILPGIPVSNGFAEQSAFEQLQDAADNSGYASEDFEPEAVREEAGYTFDNQGSTPPPVDLSGASDHPTPDLLRNEDGSNPYDSEE